MRNSSWKHCHETKLHHSQRPVTLYFNMTSHWKWNVMLIFSSLNATEVVKMATSVVLLATYFSKIWIKTRQLSNKKLHLQMLSAKWWPFCFRHNVLSAVEPSAALDSITANQIIHPRAPRLPTNWNCARIMVFLEINRTAICDRHGLMN